MIVGYDASSESTYHVIYQKKFYICITGVSLTESRSYIVCYNTNKEPA